MCKMRGCKVDEASVPTAESGSRASWDRLNKQDSGVGCCLHGLLPST